jgi:hypothetical protein
MKYALLIYTDYSTPAARENQSESAVAEMYASFGRFNEELRAAGKLGPAEELSSPDTARSVRIKDAAIVVTDGPFAEVREQLGGFYIIDAHDIDEAVSWAAKVPTVAYGTVEVRPLAPAMRPPAD